MTVTIPSADDIITKATQAMFGRPLVTNVFRSMLVEAMIADVLAPYWTWCAADYASWDFENADGLRLEVKQAAAWQTWATPGSNPSKPRFDVAHRKGSWEGPVWVEGRRRAAHIYVLAHHPLTGQEADHRDPRQWLFHVIPTTALPDLATISLAKARELSVAFPLEGLPAAVAVTATHCPVPTD